MSLMTNKIKLVFLFVQSRLPTAGLVIKAKYSKMSSTGVKATSVVQARFEMRI